MSGFCGCRLCGCTLLPGFFVFFYRSLWNTSAINDFKFWKACFTMFNSRGCSYFINIAKFRSICGLEIRNVFLLLLTPSIFNLTSFHSLLYTTPHKKIFFYFLWYFDTCFIHILFLFPFILQIIFCAYFLLFLWKLIFVIFSNCFSCAVMISAFCFF